MVWKGVSRHAIGTSHKDQDMPCQDYGDYCILGDLIIGAVADGAGSAKYSDVGAKLAVKTTLKYLKYGIIESPRSRECDHEKFDFILSDQKTNKLLKLTILPPEFVLKLFKKTMTKTTAGLRKEKAIELFVNTVKEVNIALKNEANNNGYLINDLACTLLVFVATPHWIAAMQIGDGFIVVCPQDSEDDSDYKIIFKPDKGEFVNETTFVTSTNALDEMQVEVLEGTQEFICASTDGLEKVAIRTNNWLPFPPFFKPLKEYMYETPNPKAEHKYLDEFLNSDQLNARTNDDKTLLLCLYQSKDQVQHTDLQSLKQE